MSHETTVAVFGSRKPKPGSETYELAYQLGRQIAARGWTLCNGGYGGTMEASAKGARDAGGNVLGVTCSIWGRSGINAFLSREVCTDTLFDRIRALVELSHAYIVLPGGTGTLLELSLVWEMANKNLLKDTPIILLGNFWQPITGIVAQDDSRSAHCVRQVASPTEAIEQIAACLGAR